MSLLSQPFTNQEAQPLSLKGKCPLCDNTAELYYTHQNITKGICFTCIMLLDATLIRGKMSALLGDGPSKTREPKGSDSDKSAHPGAA